jgi:hypothetical protein
MSGRVLIRLNSEHGVRKLKQQNDMISEQQAKDSLFELVKHVADHQGKPIPGLSYQELASRIGRVDKHGQAHAHGMGPAVLGRLGHMLKGVEVGWAERIPQIQCLVGLKSDPKCLPDEGICEFWPEYSQLAPVEKQVRVNWEKDQISQYGSRWNNVLAYFNVPTVKLPPNLQRVFGAGGESVAHRELKEFVRDNPSLVDVGNNAKCFTEFSLPSLDTVDVMFKERNRWTAVEVKSVVSDAVAGDYERGIYQVIKYKAILSAMRSDHRYGVAEDVRVFLVLESNLSAQLKAIATALQLNVRENVKTTSTFHG